jgi:hypothetical protein
MKQKIKEEIDKNRRFQMAMIGTKTPAIKVTDIDIRNYAKYVLREGKVEDKREILSCVRNNFVLQGRRVKAGIDEK